MKKNSLPCSLLAALLLSACARLPRRSNRTNSRRGSIYAGDGCTKRLRYAWVQLSKIGSNYCGSNALGSYLYYYDTATGTSGPLCAKPDCAHDTKDCFAYTGQGASLSYYDGKLYW